MRPAFPASEYYDGSAPSTPFGGRCAYPRRCTWPVHQRGPRRARFPRSLRFDRRAWRPALPLRPRHSYAVDLHRDLPGQTCETLPGVPRPTTSDGNAPLTSPHPPDLSWPRLEEALQHRFLTYTVPSRSPSPTHPAVLSRLDFVAAAPTLPGISRIRLPPASPTRHDGPAAESSHLRSKQQRLVAHHSSSDTPGWWRPIRRCHASLTCSPPMQTGHLPPSTGPGPRREPSCGRTPELLLPTSTLPSTGR